MGSKESSKGTTSNEGGKVSCPHSIPLEDSCGICDAETIINLKARIDSKNQVIRMVIDYINHPDPWPIKLTAWDSVVAILKEALEEKS